jgi:hypothetical protein
VITSLPPGMPRDAPAPIPEPVPMNAIQPQPLRGADLLLVHCRALGDDRPSAYSRLQESVGDELARLLVFALSGPQGRRSASAS